MDIGSDYKCYPKPLNCLADDDYEFDSLAKQFECDDCAEGYFFDEDNQCVTCGDVMDKCIDCPSLSRCTSCEKGYFPNWKQTSCM